MNFYIETFKKLEDLHNRMKEILNQAISELENKGTECECFCCKDGDNPHCGNTKCGLKIISDKMLGEISAILSRNQTSIGIKKNVEEITNLFRFHLKELLREVVEEKGKIPLVIASDCPNCGQEANQEWMDFKVREVIKFAHKEQLKRIEEIIS